jgi:hypothetical protein
MITKLSGKFLSLKESNKCLMIGRLAGSFLLAFCLIYSIVAGRIRVRGEFDKWQKKLSI